MSSRLILRTLKLAIIQTVNKYQEVITIELNIKISQVQFTYQIPLQEALPDTCGNA